MANIIKAQGFVLNTTPFKESSLFVSILTKRWGKVKVLAKGCRRPKSKFCGALEPFSLDEIIFYKRESKEIYTLSDAVIINNYDKIRSDPQKVNAGMVLCEFFEKTLPSEEHDDNSFDILSTFLNELQKISDQHVRHLTILYLFKALSGAGIRPHLDNCVRCHEPLNYNNKKLDFSIGAGGLVCERDFDDTVVFLSDQTVNTLKHIYESKKTCIENSSLAELEDLVPNYIYYHLHNIVLNSLKHLK